MNDAAARMAEILAEDARAHERLAALSNRELIEELEDLPEPLWAEVGWRLGVNGLKGVRVGARGPTRNAALRLERFRAMWQGQPEFREGED